MVPTRSCQYPMYSRMLSWTLVTGRSPLRLWLIRTRGPSRTCKFAPKGCGCIPQKSRIKLRYCVFAIFSRVTDLQRTLQLFYQEAIVWKRMNHPNIVPFRGVTLEPHQLVSDRMEGGNLIEYINGRPGVNRLGLVSVPVAALVKSRSSHLFVVHQLCDVAEGLNHLHSRSVVHGNITGVRIWRLAGDITNVRRRGIYWWIILVGRG